MIRGLPGVTRARQGDKMLRSVVPVALRPLSLPRARVRLGLNDYVAVSFVLLFVLSVAYRDVVFGGKTLLPVGTSASVNGFAAPQGFRGEIPTDTFRRYPEASISASYPWTQFIRESFRNGEVPLWNPYSGAGTPLLANGEAAPFNILKLPLLIRSTPRAWDLYFIGRLWLAGMLAYAFARRLGLRPAAAAIAPLGFILQGYFFMAANVHWLDVCVFLPLALIGVEGLIRGRWASAPLATLGVAGMYFAGQVELATIGTMLSAAFLLARAVAELAENRIRPGRVLWSALVGGLALTAGALLALPQILPYAELLENAQSTTGSRLAVTATDAALPLLVPYVDGMPLLNYSGDGPGAARNWFGVTLAILALLSVTHRQVRPGTNWFFGAGAIVLLLMIFGAPVFQDAGELPVLRFITWDIAQPMAGFCIAVAAAVGADAMLRNRSRVDLSVALAATAGALVWLTMLARETITSLPGEQLGDVFGIAGGTMIVVAVAGFTLTRRHRPPAAYALAPALIVGAELLMFAPHGIYAERWDPFARPEFVYRLQALAGKQPPGRLIGTSGLLYPNSSTAYGAEDIRVLGNLVVDRYKTYASTFLGEGADGGFSSAAPQEAETLLRGTNPFFRLGNVRYVVTAPEVSSAAPLPRPLIDAFAQTVLDPTKARRASVTINGREKPALVLVPPIQVLRAIRVDPAEPVLFFSVGVDPETWRRGDGDGMDFRVQVVDGGQVTTVYSRYIDPKNTRKERHWFGEAVDLTKWIGRDVQLALTVTGGPAGDTNNDIGLWGDLRFGARGSEPAGSSLQLIYRGADARIYEDDSALPRAFMVRTIDNVATPEQAVSAMKDPDFDPQVTAILEGVLPPEVAALDRPSRQRAAARVTVLDHEDQRVRIAVKSEGPGVLVLTDTFYPGWRAWVDGHETEIFPTDVLFRGVYVPEGTHEVEFRYKPSSFRIGVDAAFGTIGVYLGAVLGMIVATQQRRSRRRWLIR